MRILAQYLEGKHGDRRRTAGSQHRIGVTIRADDGSRIGRRGRAV